MYTSPTFFGIRIEFRFRFHTITLHLFATNIKTHQKVTMKKLERRARELQGKKNQKALS